VLSAERRPTATNQPLTPVKQGKRRVGIHVGIHVGITSVRNVRQMQGNGARGALMGSKAVLIRVKITLGFSWKKGRKNATGPIGPVAGAVLI